MDGLWQIGDAQFPRRLIPPHCRIQIIPIDFSAFPAVKDQEFIGCSGSY